MRDDAVHARTHTGEAAAAHGLIEDRLMTKIATATAVALRDIRAEQSQLACAAPDLVADVTAFARGFVLREHFIVDEALDTLAVQLEIGIQPRRAKIDGHGFTVKGRARRRIRPE